MTTTPTTPPATANEPGGGSVSPVKRLHTDKKGAVLVEFLVAVMPLMITFSSFVQVAQVATARIVVKHSAIVAARAAAVISNGHNNTPDQEKGDNQSEIESAVNAALGPWADTMDSVQVQVDDKSSGDDPYGMIQVTVTTQYHCSVPFGASIVCKAGGARTITQKASFPHQGACYTDPGGGGC
jgi:Flp pilus assembly protein TadG